MKLIIDVNVNLNATNETETLKLLKSIFKQNINTMGALEDLKAKYEVSNQKIDILITATAGVKADTIFLKKKIEELTNAGVIDAAGAAELNTIADAQNEKLTNAANELVALDEETDSSEQPEQP